jgi:hypothetical protein
MAIRRTLLDLLRAGALATGTAFLLGVWLQGLAKLGFRGSYPDGLADFLSVTVAGIALGSWLGWPAPVGRPLVLLGRIAGTALFAIIVGAAFGGLAALLAGKFDVAERNLPYYFTPAGAALVAVGLRRLPRSLAGRIALGVPVGLLVIMRLLVFWPSGAHVITRRIFPLTPTSALPEVNRVGWGAASHGQRTHLVSLEVTPTYGDDGNHHLTANADLKLGVDVTKLFYEDFCGDVHDERPQPADWVRAYPDAASCLKEHPSTYHVLSEMASRVPSPCCLYQTKERRPGERINLGVRWPFAFIRGAWRADADSD